jgi:hypothetical protein
MYTMPQKSKLHVLAGLGAEMPPWVGRVAVLLLRAPALLLLDMWYRGIFTWLSESDSYHLGCVKYSGSYHSTNK